MPVTTMRIIPTIIGAVKDVEIDLSSQPSLDALRRAIEPHLDGQRMEHVTVLFEGERRDLFVGDNSAATGIRNIRATEIYHTAALTALAQGADPDLYPEPWPPVCGPAVLFPYRRVWF